MAEVSTLPRPLLDHSPILWVTQVGDTKPSYFKLDRSWLLDERLKGEIVQWWGSRLAFGSISDQLSTKLKDLRHHLFARRRQIRTACTQSRDAALARIQALDAVEDTRPLTLDESKERKAYRGEVAEMDLRIEMDWRQRSRQLCLAAGDANTRFFHQLASGRRRMNCIRRLKIGDHVFSEQPSIGQALADHFRLFYRQSPLGRWRWLASGATSLTSTQQQDLITPLLEEEVKVAIRGLNSEGPRDRTAYRSFSTSNVGTRSDRKLWRRLRTFRLGGAI